ncbi:putative transcription factor WRKY family [Rosa chinensis]|uniref:Putative transcription factor WRKY family n=1 Tax=Rosa chinensis TaxID=74649 RepID=A0A2P6PGE2_ROSCH|nr:putative transcription factor WRKY family [Rosa chinensis]
MIHFCLIECLCKILISNSVFCKEEVFQVGWKEEVGTSLKELSDISHSEQRSQPSSLTVDKPNDDGYNWRKYGQKQELL